MLRKDPNIQIWAINAVGLYMELTCVTTLPKTTAKISGCHTCGTTHTNKQHTVLRVTGMENCHVERALTLEIIAATSADMATLGEEGLKTVVTRIVVQAVTMMENKSGSSVS